jgi:hypothetical protein
LQSKCHRISSNFSKNLLRIGLHWVSAKLLQLKFSAGSQAKVPEIDWKVAFFGIGYVLDKGLSQHRRCCLLADVVATFMPGKSSTTARPEKLLCRQQNFL